VEESEPGGNASLPQRDGRPCACMLHVDPHWPFRRSNKSVITYSAIVGSIEPSNWNERYPGLRKLIVLRHNVDQVHHVNYAYSSQSMVLPLDLN